MPSSADTEVEEAEQTVVDTARTALLEALQTDLGDKLLEHHLVPGVDLTVRVNPPDWTEIAAYLRERQRFRFFDFLSAIDWLPSPFGRSMDAAVDTSSAESDSDESEANEMQWGVTGGETRFQVFARVFSLTTNIGLTLKADVGDDMTIGTWTDTYPGADWHEREAAEMFGIQFAGHPGLRPLYLPSDFEGHPMRKDFPLLSRLIKPWPGIVDVELMPEIDQPEIDQPETDQPAAESADAPAVEAPAAETSAPESPPAEQAAPPAKVDESPDSLDEVPTAPEPDDTVEVSDGETTTEVKPENVGEAQDTSGIPAHLLNRSKQAKKDAGGES